MNKSKKPIIGVMGPGNPENPVIIKQAEQIGQEIANRNWILLTGGRKAGVMDAASKGAFETGSDVIGVLPGDSHFGMSDYVSIPILTGLGSARNVVNILTADVVIVCGMGLGTASEAALAIKHQKPTIFINVEKFHLRFFQSFTDKKLSIFDETDELFTCIEQELL